MKYEKTADLQLPFNAKYQAAFNDANAVVEAASFLKEKGQGPWERQGSNLYLFHLNDIFLIRLYFSESLKLIRETTSYQLPDPS